MKKIIAILTSIIASSCSLIGVNTGEALNYKVIEKEGQFEIREYSSYLSAQVSIPTNNDEQS